LLAKHYELSAIPFNAEAVIFAQISDGFEVGRQTIEEPYQLKITISFTL
jgi:hypothetical protein